MPSILFFLNLAGVLPWITTFLYHVSGDSEPQWIEWRQDKHLILSFLQRMVLCHLSHPLAHLWFHPPLWDSPGHREIVPPSSTPWIAARQASLAITNTRCLLKFMPIESVMPSSHLILCHLLLLLPPIPPSIRVFSNESALRIRRPKYWSSASASVLPMNTQDWSPLGWTGWISLQSKVL